MEKLLVRGKCVCLAMLPLDSGWNWVWFVSYTGCGCTHAAVRKEEYKGEVDEAEEEILFPLVPHMQKRQCCKQERGARAREGVTEEAGGHWKNLGGCPSANSVLCPLQSCPPSPCHPLIQPPMRCCAQRGLLAVESLVQVSKKVKTKTQWWSRSFCTKY